MKYYIIEITPLIDVDKKALMALFKAIETEIGKVFPNAYKQVYGRPAFAVCAEYLLPGDIWHRLNFKNVSINIMECSDTLYAHLLT